MDDIKEIIARNIDPKAWDVAEFDGESNGGVSESLNSAEDIMAALKAAGYVIFNPSELSEEDKDRLYYILAKKSGETQNEMLRECFAMIAAAGEQE